MTTNDFSDMKPPRGDLIGFFNGESSLAKTYWLGVFGFGVVARLVVKAINESYLSAQTEADYARLDTFAMCVNLFILLWTGLILRALIKCCYNNRTPGFWGWVAILLALLNFAMNALLVFSQLFPQAGSPRFMIQAELAQLNKTLPFELEPGFWLTRTELQGDEIIYHYRENTEKTEDTKAVLYNMFSLTQPDAQATCEDAQSWFHSGITAIVYRYQFTNGSGDARLEAATCLNWLAEN